MKHAWSDSLLWLASDDAKPAPMCALQIHCECGKIAAYRGGQNEFWIEGLGKYTLRQKSLYDAMQEWRKVE